MASLTGTGEFLATQSLPSQSVLAPCSLNFPLTGLQGPILPAPLNTRPPFTTGGGEDMGEGLEVDIHSHTHYNSLHGPHFYLPVCLSYRCRRSNISLSACQRPLLSWICHLPHPQQSPLVQLSGFHLSPAFPSIFKYTLESLFCKPGPRLIAQDP